jgi:hypothetical protein
MDPGFLLHPHGTMRGNYTFFTACLGFQLTTGVSKISISEAAAYNPDYRRLINGRDRDAFFQGETLSQQSATHAPHSADMQ